MFYFNEKVDWIVNQHKGTNHMYDTYLPYEFHLKMVVNVYEDFKNLLPKKMYVHNDSRDEDHDVTQEVIYLACWGHDLIEDTRVSYNDVRSKLDDDGYSFVADVVYAVTNEKGKNRKERANDKYYEGIRNTPGAVFVKLSDRIANVQYSKLTKSRMFEMYKKENEDFMIKLGYNGSPTCEYFPMFYYLNKLFKDE
jgi:(p)ppGpp synthase/HD superfamily hydrolase